MLPKTSWMGLLTELVLEAIAIAWVICTTYDWDLQRSHVYLYYWSMSSHQSEVSFHWGRCTCRTGMCWYTGENTHRYCSSIHLHLQIELRHISAFRRYRRLYCILHTNITKVIYRCSAPSDQCTIQKHIHMYLNYTCHPHSSVKH